MQMSTACVSRHLVHFFCSQAYIKYTTFSISCKLILAIFPYSGVLILCLQSSRHPELKHRMSAYFIHFYNSCIFFLLYTYLLHSAARTALPTMHSNTASPDGESCFCKSRQTFRNRLLSRDDMPVQYIEPLTSPRYRDDCCPYPFCRQSAGRFCNSLQAIRFFAVQHRHL